ncbi:hypothetical protein CVT24_004835 [Panaeolus cyanescens]|uniref:holo-[acyl-carrier-protein] synthase n=1 Tax=Panaeolus cyanescens TaxID=181874 RepID=A0A409W1Y1_9AGAR|nr:hypothetical protein CVT24_004835 [Panaeolus cyanescens]
MQVRVVIYHPTGFTDEVHRLFFYKSLFADSSLSWVEQLYQAALSVVDSESQSRIKRFYHRDDACRTLIGRLLTRTLVKERGIPLPDVKFAATAAGKPYIVSQSKEKNILFREFLYPPLAYNITHDNNLIAMAYAPGLQNSPAFSLGIDVMKLRIPGRETFASFVETVGDQLTQLEHRQINEGISQGEKLKRFFWMWTLKEAYTKALGIGLGFDFRRVEFDVVERVVRVDGRIPPGWRFNMFTVQDGDDVYQGVVAEFVGDIPTRVVDETAKIDWLTVHDAVEFTQDAIATLKTE